MLVPVVFLEQTVSAHFFYFFLFFFYFFIFFSFLDLNVIVELNLNAEINFISIHYLERMEFPTNFWNSVLPVSNCSYSIDQQNAV